MTKALAVLQQLKNEGLASIQAKGGNAGEGAITIMNPFETTKVKRKGHDFDDNPMVQLCGLGKLIPLKLKNAVLCLAVKVRV